ncbi:phosphatase domain-containing putative toxin [Winogradskyella endarachnes]|uniref:Protein tyrosine phosphatase n=1 Tax=Winogradskyella endarachnes TaxID=2681965 RepID=A0A6L6U5J9_9FLAO|nr:dual specificity protein phosphatase family protein [Winogradskyella endarachnes]MUU77473.1 protein tyrosine phosphatase [Winogradskyella endarachnes]
MNKLTLIVLFIISYGYSQDDTEKQELKTDNYTTVNSKYFNNLYCINDSLFRSEQPSKMGFKELENSGVKTIINLRRLRNDIKKAQNTDLQLEHIPLATKFIQEEDVIEVLQRVQNAEKPVLIHCWHGSDRTGVMIAAYRIIVENWTKEDAINEFKIKEFGYHKNRYPNLVELLENLNVEHIKKELGIE